MTDYSCGCVSCVHHGKMSHDAPKCKACGAIVTQYDETQHRDGCSIMTDRASVAPWRAALTECEVLLDGIRTATDFKTSPAMTARLDAAIAAARAALEAGPPPSGDTKPSPLTMQQRLAYQEAAQDEAFMRDMRDVSDVAPPAEDAGPVAPVQSGMPELRDKLTAMATRFQGYAGKGSPFIAMHTSREWWDMACALVSAAILVDNMSRVRSLTPVAPRAPSAVATEALQRLVNAVESFVTKHGYEGEFEFPLRDARAALEAGPPLSGDTKPSPLTMQQRLAYQEAAQDEAFMRDMRDVSDVAPPAEDAGPEPTILRNDSTPEGKKIWDAVARCADSAPQWVKDQLGYPAPVAPREPSAAAIEAAAKALYDEWRRRHTGDLPWDRVIEGVKRSYREDVTPAMRAAYAVDFGGSR